MFFLVLLLLLPVVEVMMRRRRRIGRMPRGGNGHGGIRGDRAGGLGRDDHADQDCFLGRVAAVRGLSVRVGGDLSWGVWGRDAGEEAKTAFRGGA